MPLLYTCCRHNDVNINNKFTHGAQRHHFRDRNIRQMFYLKNNNYLYILGAISAMDTLLYCDLPLISSSIQIADPSDRLFAMHGRYSI